MIRTSFRTRWRAGDDSGWDAFPFRREGWHACCRRGKEGLFKKRAMEKFTMQLMESVFRKAGAFVRKPGKRLFPGLAVASVLLFQPFMLPAAAQGVPQPSSPPRLVNDFAGILAQSAPGIERLLRSFDDSTSNQVTVVTVSDLGGYDPARFAYEIGEQWGVGNRKHDNGIVILIKPKNANGNGQAYIAVGYGLEGAIPDAVCKRIVEDEMIPFFRNGDYAGGLLNGLKVLLPLAAGEISAKEYMPSSGGFIAVFLAFILIVLVVSLVGVASKKGKGDRFGGPHDDGIGSGLGTWWLLSSAMNGGHHGGSWGSFSNGSGSFGGFGGGSFGGGGAGGSW